MKIYLSKNFDNITSSIFLQSIVDFLFRSIIDSNLNFDHTEENQSPPTTRISNKKSNWKKDECNFSIFNLNPIKRFRNVNRRTRNQVFLINYLSGID